LQHNNNIPAHLAIIMDGNGRWAKKNNLPIKNGHRKGAETAKVIIEECVKKGISYLTLYTFSSENWNRPEGEVKDILVLLQYYLQNEALELAKDNIKVKFIGDISAFAEDIQDLCGEIENKSSENSKLQLNLALNYGSKLEIVEAVNKILESGQNKVTENEISKHLYTSNTPDPDLMIRTGGDQRISNFLLWQLAYTELYFCETLWPEFGVDDLGKAIKDYSNRERRFGGR
jgi:undecaprenyl diphosphate synthase